jgi:hypothetical protein
MFQDVKRKSTASFRQTKKDENEIADELFEQLTANARKQKEALKNSGSAVADLRRMSKGRASSRVSTGSSQNRMSVGRSWRIKPAAK